VGSSPTSGITQKSCKISSFFYRSALGSESVKAFEKIAAREGIPKHLLSALRE
jgi:hypothetical protein